jgi:O-antigen/teichoic acid export membrane protein
MARRLLANSAVVAAGTLVGNGLSYGFSFTLSHKLGPTGYGQIGSLLAIYLIASVPATAIQVVTARRVARVHSADPAAIRRVTGPLLRWSMLIGLGTTLVLALASPLLSLALPALSTAQIALTALTLLPNALIYCYLGIAQGSGRFTVFSVLFVLSTASKFAVGVVSGDLKADPGIIMGAMAASWVIVAACCHYVLRDLAGPRSLVKDAGYLGELGTASWGLGAVLLLSLLDGLLAAHYFRGEELGRYQAGALFTRAGYFGPQFVAVLVFPRLAVPETRVAALRAALAAAVGIGSVTVLASVFIAPTLIKVAFGQAYLSSAAGFNLASAAWIFALSGAIQALVQLALLDAIARRSAVIGWTVLGSILVELIVITTVAHHSPVQLITTAAGVSSVAAAVGLLIALRSKSPAALPQQAETPTELAPVVTP